MDAFDAFQYLCSEALDAFGESYNRLDIAGPTLTGVWDHLTEAIDDRREVC